MLLFEVIVEIWLVNIVYSVEKVECCVYYVILFVNIVVIWENVDKVF